MKSIAVPINFSPCAFNAARYAAELMMTESLYQEMVEAANIALQRIKAELTARTHNKVKIDYSVEAGSVAAKVSDLCRQMKPYAIIVGTTSPTLEKFLAGSSVASLLRNLDYPVLVVPESAAFHRLGRILLACDLDDIGSGMPNSLPLLKDLRDHFGSRFDIVTVDTHKVLSDKATVIESGGWKTQLKDLYLDFHYIRKSKVEDGILEYLSHNEADLVMVFPKKHGLLDFHTSQSRKLVEHSPIPVLSFHE